VLQKESIEKETYQDLKKIKKEIMNLDSDKANYFTEIMI